MLQEFARGIVWASEFVILWQNLNSKWNESWHTRNGICGTTMQEFARGGVWGE